MKSPPRERTPHDGFPAVRKVSDQALSGGQISGTGPEVCRILIRKIARIPADTARLAIFPVRPRRGTTLAGFQSGKLFAHPQTPRVSRFSRCALGEGRLWWDFNQGNCSHTLRHRAFRDFPGAPSERDDFGGISIREIVRTPLDTARFAIFPIYPWRRTIFTPIGRFFTWT